MSEVVVRQARTYVPTHFVEEQEPKRHLSLPRVAFALAILAGGLFAGFTGIKRSLAAPAPPTHTTWYAPYVDATLTPTYNFQDTGQNPARQVVLGFVVASSSSSCSPSWGGYYSLSGADTNVNLARRVSQYESLGGTVAISFGGEDNEELAIPCTSTAALERAYASVINHYNVSTLDFDIEGTALANSTSITRHAAALRLLERRYPHRNLHIWLTVPVGPDGLGPDVTNVVSSTLAAHVSISGVNLMAMDYGQAEPNMEATVEGSLSDAATQLQSIERRYGITLRGASLWNHIGATVMIGQNDTTGEQFTPSDADELVAFVKRRDLGRVSIWSLNRDASCGSTFSEVGVLSNTCSGVTQAHLQFSHFLGTLAGSMQLNDVLSTGTPVIDTNPADAPYPLWQPSYQYETGYKVVRNGDVYQAKWYNEGEDPAANVAQADETPWLLIGPVLSSDRAPTITTLPLGTDPAWSSKTVYQAGQKVLFNGLPYQASWYNVGNSPAQALADPSSSPWKALYQIPGEPAAQS